MIECWAPAFRFEDRYEVSDKGRVRNAATKHILSQNKMHGYRTVCLWDGKRNTVRVHRIVASTFIRPPKDADEQVNHLNFDKADNRVQNLEWCTGKENTVHAHLGGRRPKTNTQKLFQDDISTIKNMAMQGLGAAEIAAVFHVVPLTIKCVISGKTHRGSGKVQSSTLHPTFGGVRVR